MNPINRAMILSKTTVYCIAAIVVFLSSCKKLYNLPEDKPYLSPDANYTSAPILRPILGRNTIFSYFKSDYSSFPIRFEIIDFTNLDRTSSDKLGIMRNTYIWKRAYTGQETSLDEINGKRAIEERPLFQVNSAGEFIMWASATDADFRKSLPDTGYRFNVKISNGGGEKILGPLFLAPLATRPYEPSYHLNEITAAPRKEVSGALKRLIPATLVNMFGATTGNPLVRETGAGTTALKQDVWVYFKRKGAGNTLTIKFFDKDSIAINPTKFNGTKWEKLVHGFNPVITPTSVKYEVAYPIPLTSIPTPYTTSDGSQALLTFSYNRIGFSGLRVIATMTLPFNIYQPGDWEIIFFFHNENPKFEDE
ncbi:DUF5007 domain-containing protein [Mucilaginibacter terrae]|uniref:DUF5007 domain-containing protein n=1 Tax=Mucilaginibacter terrae TaxID=1955052 RepID=A0ABU3GMY9_9SPHI|nr:DUF5007 domain-containing protein [Mucilaginibacter terrae]MDT3401149.1 hypothetical protein [Mucilaginibacter terrae]